ncbi:MAG: biotin--[acetyl-CoA-carboxylase] ligase [Oscillospiraceae bacterium]|nr:biotin--[acetyl-CoA-carboxylase] ligase [Oscillospiraceae bacterium]
MGTKEEILERLCQAAGRDVSGQELAAELGISRTAVWKAIRMLQREGYRIAAGQNRGYRLESAPDRLSETEIRSYLGGLDVCVLQTVDSTNTEAKRRVVAGLRTPLLLAAEEQTAGRGRQGKSFYSPRGVGAYLTLVVHPEAAILDAVSITTRASVAVCRAIRKLTREEPEIKWVNDVYLHGKKCCGMLVEAVSDFETGVTKSLIIGIGVNMTNESFPEDLPNAAALRASGLSRNRLIAEIAAELLHETADLQDRSYLEDYRAWSMVLGREITFLKEGVLREGRAVDIDDQGGLVVEDAQGARQTLQSGEITVRLR